MASTEVKSGALVMLSDLDPSGPYFMDGASLRVTGNVDGDSSQELFESMLVIWLYRLGDDGKSVSYQNYSVETAIATIADGGVALNIDTQHLRDLSFRLGSIYQFIGELHIEPNNKAILQARVGRNVDGMDLNLYHQSLQLVRQFEAGLMKFPMN